MNLDDLIQDAVKLKAAKKAARRSGRPKQGNEYRHTKEEIRKLMLENCVPTSVHLHLTYQVCECGSGYESVNCVPLVLCVGPTLKHYRSVESQRELETFDALPRFIETTTINVPYCADCFVNAHHRERDPDPLSFVFDWSVEEQNVNTGG